MSLRSPRPAATRAIQVLFLYFHQAYSLLILRASEPLRIMTEMQYKYTYPVIDRELRNFLAFVLLLLAVVAVAAAIGSVSGVNTTAINAQTMGFPANTVQPLVPPQAQEHIDEHVPIRWIEDPTDPIIDDPIVEPPAEM